MIPVVTVVAFTLMGEHLSKQVDESNHPSDVPARYRGDRRRDRESI